MNFIKMTYGNNITREAVTVESTSTLRSALESVEFDYTRGALTLDGASLKPGDIDKTFDELNIGDKCFVMSVAKVDNAANAVLVGEAVVIISTIKAEDLKMLAKYNPAALILKGGENNKTELYRIGFVENKPSSINPNGAIFNGATEDGRAMMTINMSAIAKKEDVADTYGEQLILINELEAAIPERVAATKAKRDTVLNSISTTSFGGTTTEAE